MILCDTIKHHNKNGKPCALGFWHFLTSEKISGFSASLSAQSPVNRKIYGTFLFTLLSSPPFLFLGYHYIKTSIFTVRYLTLQ